MIELGGLDAQEKDVVAGFKLAQQEINKLIAFQEQIRTRSANRKRKLRSPSRTRISKQRSARS